MATKQATKAGRKAARTTSAAKATAASSKTAASPKTAASRNRGEATSGSSKAATAASVSSNRGAPSSKAVPAGATPAKRAPAAKAASSGPKAAKAATSGPKGVAAAKARSPNAQPDPATVRTEVLELFRACYPSPDGIDEPDATILAMDPKAFALDPAPFHETLQARFGVGASGGTVAHTVAQIAAAWDGTLRD